MQLKEKKFKRENESRVKKVVLRTRKINTADLTSAATIIQHFLVCQMPYKEGRSDDWQILLVLRVLRACWNNSPSSVTSLGWCGYKFRKRIQNCANRKSKGETPTHKGEDSGKWLRPRLQVCLWGPHWSLLGAVCVIYNAFPIHHLVFHKDDVGVWCCAHLTAADTEQKLGLWASGEGIEGQSLLALSQGERYCQYLRFLCQIRHKIHLLKNGHSWHEIWGSQL